MKVKSQKITDFLDGKNAHFMIPAFQRPYEWVAKEQCQILLDDLKDVAKNPRPHFFGTVVRVIDTSTGDSIIIDGQQRLTTVSLLMLAIAHKTEELGKSTDIELPRIEDVLSLCIDYRKHQKLKLKLSNKDMHSYSCVANKERCPEYEKSKIVQNYKYFYTALDEENINDIYKAAHSLEIVDILLEPSDGNPQLVFESLNSKGLGLTEADKICNYILIGLDYEQQTEFYTKYWQPMEENVGTSPDDTTQYIWRFLQYKTNMKIGDKGLYQRFKQFCSEKNVASILCEMYEKSMVYHDIITRKIKKSDGTGLSEHINKKINNILSALKMQTALPLMLDVIDKYYLHQIPENDVVELLSVLEAYIIRRVIVGSPTSVYNGFFLMNNEIDKMLKRFDDSTYLDAFKHLIHNAPTRAGNPSDTEVFDSLLYRNVYSNQNVCNFILSTIEEKNNPKEQINTIGLSIEHIMPQKLTGHDGKKWQEELGADWESVHDKYLHTIGNLTLTGYNPEYSNRSFYYKKHLQDVGFDFSPLYLNSFMKETEIWDKEQIERRGRILAKRILNLWPVYEPVKQYSSKRDIDKFCLDNSSYKDAIMGKKPNKVVLSFIDDEINVSSWKDLYCQIINILFNSADYKSKMQHAFDFGNNGKFTEIISNVEEKRGKQGERMWEQIIPENPVWFKTCKSSIDICIALTVWLKYLGIPLEDVEIYLR